MSLENSSVFSENEVKNVHISTSLDHYMKINKVSFSQLLENGTKFNILNLELHYLRCHYSLNESYKIISCYDLDVIWKIEYLYRKMDVPRNRYLFPALCTFYKNIVFSNIQLNMSPYFVCYFSKVKLKEAFGMLYDAKEESEKRYFDALDDAKGYVIESGLSILYSSYHTPKPVGDYEDYYFSRCFYLEELLPEKFSYKGCNFIKRISLGEDNVISLLPFSLQDGVSCKRSEYGFHLKADTCLFLDMEDIMENHAGFIN